MKLIIGLGNPGNKYKNNRHNAGFAVIDKLQTEISKSRITNSKQITALKSQNFMNDSGSFVLSQYSKFNIPYSSLYIVHDDLDIPLGSFKIQFNKGPKDHNGLNDIYDKLGTSEFWHVRVGIENRQQALGTRISGEEYVLQDFTAEEMKVLENVIREICNQLAN